MEEQKLNYISHYIGAMLPYMLGALPLILLFRFFWIRKMGRSGGKMSLWREVGMIVFFMYLAGLASQAVIPFSHRIDFHLRSYNLVPFKIFSDAWREASINHNSEPLIISLAGNIGIFIPMGFFISWLWRKTLKQTVLISFLASLTIEFCQIPQARCSDIDDLWMNTLGGLIGWLICYVMHKQRRKKCENLSES
jgi:glycopeptide antibiotics resistance protein